MDEAVRALFGQSHVRGCPDDAVGGICLLSALQIGTRSARLGTRIQLKLKLEGSVQILSNAGKAQVWLYLNPCNKIKLFSCSLKQGECCDLDLPRAYYTA